MLRPPGTAPGGPLHSFKSTSFDMGYGDNRRTPKMNQRKRQTKLHLRLKRRALEVRAQRQSKNPLQAAEPANKKSKVKKEKAPKAEKN